MYVVSLVFQDNVLVGDSGEPLICDFGISRMLNSSLSITGSSTGALRGSARWMAPELFDIMVGNACHTKETDVWAFGMTVFVRLPVRWFSTRADRSALGDTCTRLAVFSPEKRRTGDVCYHAGRITIMHELFGRFITISSYCLGYM